MASANDIKAGAAYVSIYTRDDGVTSGLKGMESQVTQFQAAISQRSRAMAMLTANTAVQQQAELIKGLRAQEKSFQAAVRAAKKDDKDAIRAELEALRARIIEERQALAKLETMSARYAASPMGQREAAAADMVRRSAAAAAAKREEAAAQRSLNAALAHFNTTAGLSAAAMRKYSAEVQRGTQLKRAFGVSAGGAKQALMNTIFMVEDAASVWGTSGLAGALRAASNNLTVVAMSLGGPVVAGITVAVVAATQFAAAFAKGTGAVKSAQEQTESYTDSIRGMNEAIAEQIRFRQQLQDLDSVADVDRERGRKANELEVLDAQREKLVAQQDALAGALPALRDGRRLSWLETAHSLMGSLDYSGRGDQINAELRERTETLEQLKAVGEAITKLDRERARLRGELSAVTDRGGPIAARAKIEADAAAQAQQDAEADRLANERAELLSQLQAIDREEQLSIQQRGRQRQDALDPRRAALRDALAEMRSAIALIQRYNPANAKQLIQLEIDTAKKKIAEFDQSDPRLEAQQKLREALISSRQKADAASRQTTTALDLHSSEALRAIVSATTAPTKSPEQRIIETLEKGNKITADQLLAFKDLIDLWIKAKPLVAKQVK